MNGVAQLLEGPPLDERRRVLADVIRRSGQRLLRVIDDLLDVSRLDAERLALEPHRFKLSRPAIEPAQRVPHLAEEKGIAPAVRIEPGLRSHVEGDPKRLRQVVTYLLGNAVVVTEAEEVLADLAVAEGACDWGELRLRVRVRDAGPAYQPGRAGL